MKKSKKVLISIAVILVVLLVAAYFVLLSLYPEQTKNWTMTAWEWLNKPLPVVGVSTLFILIFLWKIFANSSFGKKKISELKELLNATQTELENKNKIANDRINNLIIENEELKNKLEEAINIIKEICKTSPNKKIQAIGDKYYGETKETINNETTTD